MLPRIQLEENAMQRNLTVIIAVILLTTLSYAQKAERGPRFSPWSAAVPLGPPINLPGFDDHAAVLSRDGKTMYFSSTRQGSANGSEDIWVATRKNKNSSWQTPVNLGPSVNTPSMERVRTLSSDDRVLLFQSNRAGSVGGADIWAIVRKHTNDDSGWSEPINLGSVINTNFDEIAGIYVGAGNPKLVFASFRTDIGSLGAGDIFESDILANGSYGAPVNRFELNSPSIETCFWVRDDGLEIIFSSNRPDLTGSPGAFDLWAATRSNVYETWSPPTNLGPAINEPAIQDVNPALSADGRTMLFASRRGAGDMNVYISTRRVIRAD